MSDFKKQKDIDEKADDLREAAAMCNDEGGEWWVALTDLVPGYRDGASEQFSAAIEAEILREHRRLREEFRVEERERTVTQKIRELVYCG